MAEDDLYVGILWTRLAVTGARSLKDRRRAVVSLRDRIRARFSVSCHEVGGRDAHGVASLLITTGGGEPATLGAVLDKVEAFLHADAGCIPTQVERQVRGWPDPPPWEDDDV